MSNVIPFPKQQKTFPELDGIEVHEGPVEHVEMSTDESDIEFWHWMYHHELT